jgi:dephospho-CoA kinase
MHTLIAVAGMTGAGKSVVSDRLAEKGYHFLRLGQITLDEVKRRGLPPIEEHERAIREEFRKDHGMGAFAILNLPKIEELLKKGDVVIDNLMSWSEYKILKERYGAAFVVVAVEASPEKRYARLEARTLHAHDTAVRYRPLTREQARSRDYSEIEKIEKGGQFAMADYHIINEGSMEEFSEQIEKFLSWLEHR